MVDSLHHVSTRRAWLRETWVPIDTLFTSRTVSHYISNNNWWIVIYAGRIVRSVLISWRIIFFLFSKFVFIRCSFSKKKRLRLFLGWLKTILYRISWINHSKNDKHRNWKSKTWIFRICYRYDTYITELSCRRKLKYPTEMISFG